MNTIDVLALDLEGTLISNAVSQIPRPGLHAFLSACAEHFARVVMFTAVREEKFREIARLLVEEGVAPGWFLGIEYIQWNGPTKDLNFIPNTEPARCRLVDDIASYVHPEQQDQWIRIQTFDHPYPDDDAELARVQDVLRGDHLPA
jgi:hypothetical protein